MAVAEEQREAIVHPGDNLLLGSQDAAQAGALFLEVRERKAGGLGRRIRVCRMPATNERGREGLCRPHRRGHRFGHRRVRLRVDLRWHRRHQEEEEDHMTATFAGMDWAQTFGQRDRHQ